MTTSHSRTLYWAEAAAVLYLVAPLFLFFSFYIRPDIGLPGSGLIAFFLYKIIRQTDWSGIRHDIKSLLIILPISMGWLTLAGQFGGLSQNSDWLKHYAVINFIATHDNTLSDIYQGHFEALRYYLGWYLIPGLAVKLSSGHGQMLFSGGWTLIGIVLFFTLMARLLETKIKYALLIGLIVFILFGGADIIGFSITQFKIPIVRFPLGWWASWVQYGSNTATLFWAPQHALPAWLGIALLMRQLKKPSLLPYFALICSAILFWSPLVLIGLIPFSLAILIKQNVKKTLADWRWIITLICISLPLISYFMSNVSPIPHGLIWQYPEVWKDGPRFTWHGYVLFLLLTVTAPIALLFTQKTLRNRFLIVTTISLILIPLYRIGVLNDFAVRASLPAIAFLSIGMAHILGSKTFSFALRIMAILILIIGASTPLCEIARGFFPATIPISPTITFDTPFIGSDPLFRPQYFSTQPIPLLRQKIPL